MAETISIINQKGGVGKTTTVHNLADFLGSKGYKVLCIDIDAQASLTIASGIDPREDENIMYMMEDPKKDFIKKKTNYDLIPSSLSLSEFDMYFTAKLGREKKLKECIAKYKDKYDFILLDCSPTLGLATVNALVASDKLLIPQQTEFFSMKGLTLIFQTLKNIKDNNLNDDLELLGIVLTLFDRRKRLHKDVKELIEETFKDKVFDSVIRSNADLATAPSHFKPIFAYNPKSYGAQDYRKLGNELLKRLKKGSK